jgi:hypothetical protein
MKSRLAILIILVILLNSCKKDDPIAPKPVNASVESVTINNQLVLNNQKVLNITPDSVVIEINFSSAINVNKIDTLKCFISNGIGNDFTVIPSTNNKKLILFINPKLKFLSSYKLYILDGESLGINLIDPYEYSFVTNIDTTPKFPLIPDEELLSMIQRQSFKYFWDYAHPVSGLARERLGSGDVVTAGGSGFGLMAILVGIERGFITRQEGYERLNKIVNFLSDAKTDKFHGAFPHWLNGSTGKVIPFGTKDNGADLVETAYLIQGLLTVREYFKNGSADELILCNSITQLWEKVEWSWFRRGNQNVLYWHWSPNYGWDMNMQIQGWSECLIVYVLAASSPTYGIPKEVYTSGWARNGAFPMKNGKTFYGITLPLSWDFGGPLFWAHYSFLGLDPRNLSDQYANYWEQNIAHSRINYEYCKANPKKYPGYSANCWGLTASDVPKGYAANEPSNDQGVITPTAAISSIVYTPDESLAAIRFFYYTLGDKLWGQYGFYDAFDLGEQWWATSVLAIDQGPEICMIENYRTALLWNNFMSNPEIQTALTTLGFTY